MSVQVTYKKQIILGIMLLIVFLVVLEGALRIYNNYSPGCYFIDSQAYKDLDIGLKRVICLDNENLKWVHGPYLHLIPNQHFTTININADGFRGEEITKEKPQNTYRIFVVGGSTAFGVGSTSDSTTIPGYLQKLFNLANSDLKVEVINAGIPKAYSYTEINYIKDKLLEYKPDLFIVYDGWNDEAQPYDKYKKPIDGDSKLPGKLFAILLKNDFYKTPQILFVNWSNWRIKYTQIEPPVFDNTDMDKKVLLWQNSWEEICKLGQKDNFQVIVTVQPLVGTGNKKLTEEEQRNYVRYGQASLLPYYEKYANSLHELDNSCDKTADLRGIFDNVTETVFFDKGHTSDFGNKIVATKLFDLSLPLVMENR